MQAAIPAAQLDAQQHAASQPTPTAYAQQYRSFSVRTRMRVALRLHLLRWRRTQRIWVSTLRSSREHIRLQYAREPELGDLGPAVQVDGHGNLVENTRIAPRILYTEKWLSVCPWTDSVDLEIFLMGFDAAEQWYGSSGTRSDYRHDVQSAWPPPLASLDAIIPPETPHHPQVIC